MGDLVNNNPSPEQVKLIFNNTYQGKAYGNFNLSHIIIKNMQGVDHDTKKDIMTDTYNFYLKYKDASTNQEYTALISESNEVDKKHPFPLCHKIIIELLNIIDGYVKVREGFK